MPVGFWLLLQYIKARQNADTRMLSLRIHNSDAAVSLQDKPEATTWQRAIPERDGIWPGQQCMLPFICGALLCPIWSSESHMHTDSTCIFASCQARCLFEAGKGVQGLTVAPVRANQADVCTATMVDQHIFFCMLLGTGVSCSTACMSHHD